MLFEVNGNNVYCSNPEQIGNLLLGIEGSQVRSMSADFQTIPASVVVEHDHTGRY